MGPVCTQMLADYGADVIKIERPGAGDLSPLDLRPRSATALDNPVFCSLNRNKRSVALDLRDAEQARRSSRRWSQTADVVVNNFRAGVMDRMGFGYEDCSRKINPRIIYAVGTGFGESGPYAHKGGQDVLAQAMSGVMARKRRPIACRCRSMPPRWPTTRPACTWCRASCSRCCSASAPARARRSACRSTTRCWRCRCRKRR